jgi:hypothetical protein
MIGEAMKLTEDFPLLIEFKRTEKGPETNVLHTVVRHSPDGFEWGYAGSGPAELALNTLLLFVDPDTADLLYYQFKMDFIAKIPRYGGAIDSTTIRDWIQTQMDGAK